MSKQDRQGVRTASDLERKYRFGQTFAEVLGIANDAQDLANEAKDAVNNLDASLTPDEVFNRLTNNSTDQGIYREDGKIFVNASYIKTGFISSDLIKAGVIRSLDYEMIEIDELYPSDSLYPDVGLFPNDGKNITKGMEIDFGAGVIRGSYFIGGQPRNLLDNSNFMNPVNQRGITSVTANGYNIDRWRTFHDTDTVTVNSGYISLSDRLYQVIPAEKIDTNKTYTAVAMQANGNLLLSVTNGVSTAQSGNPAVYISDDKILFQILGGGNFIWAALYEGEYTAETLPMYVAKEYAVEMAECMRYFIRFGKSNQNNHIGWAQAATATVANAILPLPQSMRAYNPKITISGTMVLRNGVTDIAITSASINSCGSGPFGYIAINSSGMTPGQMYAVRLVLGTFDLSADL